MDISPGTHVCHQLITQLAMLDEYPPGMQCIANDRRIPRTAFFPGGFGIWNPDGGFPALPSRPVVIVGHNWGTPSDHDEAFAEGIEYSDDWTESKRRIRSTWWNLLPILRGAGITPDRCFFTNAYMGLKDDGGGNVGDLASAPLFEQRCREFLGFQLLTLKPGIVLALGKPAIRMLGQLVPALTCWIGPRGGERTLPDIRRRNHALVQDASIHADSAVFVAVATAHTCDSRNLSAACADEILLLARAMSIAYPEARQVIQD